MSRSRAFMTIGQSFAVEGYSFTPAYYAFAEAVRRAIESSASSVQATLGGTPTIVDGDILQRRMSSFEGSAVLAAHLGTAGNYWVEDDGITAGPRLTTTIAAITALTQKPAIFLYSHGQQDAGFVTNSTEATAVADAMIDTIIADVRTEAGSSSIPVFVSMLGPRFEAQEMGEYLLRDAIIDMVNGASNVFWGAENYACRLDSTTHPSEDNRGYGYMGAQVGRRVAEYLLTGASLSGPTIGTVTRSGSDVTVPINVPAGKSLVKPADPDFIGLWDGSGNRLSIISNSWASDTLTVTVSGTPTTFRYPARPLRPYDLDSIIRLTDPVDPLYSGEPGLPLESKKTVTLA